MGEFLAAAVGHSTLCVRQGQKGMLRSLNAHLFSPVMCYMFLVW